jgi:mRNA interferase HigB
MQAYRFQSPADVKRVFGSRVDFLPNDLVVFDIGGNKYRLSVNVRYRIGCVFVREVMTHDEYSRRSARSTL